MEVEIVYGNRDGAKKIDDSVKPINVPRVITITLDIEPMGAVRTTRKSKNVDKRFKKYTNYKTSLKWLFVQALRDLDLDESDINMDVLPSVTFYLKTPKSYPERINTPHQEMPDVDNMLKGIMDALLKQDKQVHYVGRMRKLWAERSYIELELELK